MGSNESSMGSIRSRKGSYGPTDGPRSSCPSVRLDSSSRLRDPVEYVSKAKHRWAGHIMRRIDDRWTKRTLEWIPRNAKRPRGRPPTR
ncbi:hypothetical protein RB195_001751 [Necator americanus]|uniref:Uncharacterized protein n=1 Tax=Necator americanus TaxID=51031 RepID=A0ABR1DFR4_NECAM